MTKIILGVFIGMALMLLIYLFYNNIILINRENKFIISQDSTQLKRTVDEEIKDKPIIRIFQLDEEITSLTKRFDDLYVLGSIIIALLLAINIGVYIRADAEIERHFKENFTKYKEQVINAVSESESLIKQAQTELDLISKLRSSIESDKKNLTPNDNNDSTKSKT